jgi:small neutral amino acid transporter SnatA (MarC family)
LTWNLQAEEVDSYEMVTSYMGVIVIAMGVQFAMNGIKGFLA